MRQTTDASRRVAVVMNLTPVLRHGYRIGLPVGGVWREALNSDAGSYAGSNQGNLGRVTADALPAHGQPCSANLTLPPMSVLAFQPESNGPG